MTDPDTTIGIVAYPGAMRSAVLGLDDLLGHAGKVGRKQRRGALVPLIVDADPGPARFGALVLPPSLQPVETATAPWIAPWIGRQHAAGAVICSACAGLVWLVEAGLPGARPVTTHWGLEPLFRKTHPELILDIDRLLIEHTDIITAGGVMAWVDLGLALIDRFLGHDVALATARHFIVDASRRDQRRYKRFTPDLRHGDTVIVKSQHAMEAHHADRLTVPRLAAIAGLAPRTFLRRFQAATGLTPTTYLQELRVEKARDRLLHTARSVTEIGYDVGYSDPTAFARVFIRLTGMTPSAFRKAFGGEPRHPGDDTVETAVAE